MPRLILQNIRLIVIRNAALQVVKHMYFKQININIMTFTLMLQVIASGKIE